MKSCKCIPEGSITSINRKLQDTMFIIHILKIILGYHNCSKNDNGLNAVKKFCGQGQSIIFTFSNAQLLVI